MSEFTPEKWEYDKHYGYIHHNGLLIAQKKARELLACIDGVSDVET